MAVIIRAVLYEHFDGINAEQKWILRLTHVDFCPSCADSGDAPARGMRFEVSMHFVIIIVRTLQMVKISSVV